MTKKRGVDWLLLALVIVGALAVLAPFYLILVNSFKSPIDYANGGPLALPESLDFTGIVTFWERVNFPEKVWNSIFISGVVAVLAVLISMLNAFAIGIGRVRGRTWIVLLFLMANLLPQEALLYPLYYMFKEVGPLRQRVVGDHHLHRGPGGFRHVPSLGGYGTFPKEILEAASIDGAGRWKILWRVVFPISRPTLSVLLIFFFIWTWNEFLIPLTFLASNANQTVPVAISVLQGDRLMDVTTTSALGAAGHHPDAHLLPHLPAHPHPGHHGRSSQVMKFTDGFWQLRPGVTALYAQEAYDIDTTDAAP